MSVIGKIYEQQVRYLSDRSATTCCPTTRIKRMVSLKEIANIGKQSLYTDSDIDSCATR